MLLCNQKTLFFRNTFLSITFRCLLGNSRYMLRYGIKRFFFAQKIRTIYYNFIFCSLTEVSANRKPIKLNYFCANNGSIIYNSSLLKFANIHT